MPTFLLFLISFWILLAHQLVIWRHVLQGPFWSDEFGRVGFHSRIWQFTGQFHDGTDDLPGGH